MAKRYYWLKLSEDFFRRGYVRRLRRLPQGDRLTLIYLELLLAGLKTDGLLAAEGPEDFAEELALELYEAPEEVKTLLKYLSERGKLTKKNDTEYHLTDSDELTGSERDSARRMRDLRRREEAAAALRETDDAEVPICPAPAPAAAAEPLSRLSGSAGNAPELAAAEPLFRPTDVPSAERMTEDEFQRLLCRKD